MDSIDTPLNDARYITDQLEKILEIGDKDEAFEMMQKNIINRTNPGPGSFYDSPGDDESWSRFPDLLNWKDDPCHMDSPFRGFPIFNGMLNDKNDEMKGLPQAWQKFAAVHYSMPMRIRYENLDPEAEYTLKIRHITSRSEIFAKTVQLTANGEKLEFDTSRMESKNPLFRFALPNRLTAGGSLLLTWSTPRGEPLTCVAEIFLVKRRITASS